jgi:hypothetical protein
MALEAQAEAAQMVSERGSNGGSAGRCKVWSKGGLCGGCMAAGRRRWGGGTCWRWCVATAPHSTPASSLHHQPPPPPARCLPICLAPPLRALQLAAPSDNIESKFRALEGSDVDDELSKMKASIGGGSKVAGQVGGWVGGRAGAVSRC